MSRWTSDLRLSLPAAWRRQAGWLWLLLPLSGLYGLLFYFNKLLYGAGFRARYRAPVPVWVIGNLTAGGNGKTPLIALLYRLLNERGWPVVIISRGYGGRGPFPCQVRAEDSAVQCGDEPLMLAQSGLRVVAGPDRRKTIETALTIWPDTRLILSDDGLQHHALHHDLAWIVIDQQLSFGNGLLLPAGPLRECPRWQHWPRIWQVDSEQAAQQLAAQGRAAFWLEAGAWQPIQPDQDDLPPQSGQLVQAVAGIGQPARFFASVQQLGLMVQPWPFPDHHDYQASDMPEGLIVTTAKDAVKLRPLGVRGWILPVQARCNGVAEQLLQEAIGQLSH